MDMDREWNWQNKRQWVGFISLSDASVNTYVLYLLEPINSHPVFCTYPSPGPV